MKMNTGGRRPLMIIVGILLAVLAGGAAFVLGSQGTAPPAVATSGVLVAVREIPARTTVTSDDFAVRQIPTDMMLTQAYTDNSTVVGRVNTQAVYTGQQVTPNLFATAGANESFSILDPDELVEDASPFWRAVSVSVPKSRAVGGEIQAGNRVDLFVTVEFATTVQVPVADPDTGEISFETTDGAVAVVDPATGKLVGVRGGMSTKVTFQDVQVLNVNVEEDLYVLKVSLHQAEQIVHLSQERADAFGLALRPSQDTRQIETAEYGETLDRIIMEGLVGLPLLVDLEELLGFPVPPGTPSATPAPEVPAAVASPNPGEVPGESPQP
jgi:Flp pilus assembly protein CpaB